MQLSFKGDPSADMESLIAAISDAELRSPLRSTVPSVAYWREPTERLAEFTRCLGVPAPENPEFHFEYAVPVQAGLGEPSMTDLMVLGKDDAIAIEAKYTEPPYPSVSEWLGSPESENRRSVLGGWLDLLNSFTGGKLTRVEVSDVTYQVVHRAASACVPAAARRSLVYLVFSDAHAAHYRAQLRRLSDLCKAPTRLPCFLALVDFEGSPAYVELVDRWKTGERDLSGEVRQVLHSAGHFAFSEPRIERF